MKTQSVSQEFIDENRAMIAVAEACWRNENPSYSWHVFEWMAWKLRCKYLLMMRGSGVVGNITL